MVVSSIDYLCTIAKAELALIAGKGAPFDDVDSMIVYTKEQGQLPVAIMAPPQMLMMKATSRTIGADFNLVTADGGAESIKQVLGGQVLSDFASGEHLPYLETGDMKVIASGNQSRLSYALDVKTFVESGIDVFVDPVFRLAMGKGTDPDAVAVITAAIDEAIKSDGIAEIVMNAVNGKPLNLGPQGTQQMMTGSRAAAPILFAK